MTNDRKPGPGEPEEPLSATAMFFRSLDEAAQAKQETPGRAPEKPGAGPLKPPSSSGPGEFTQIFGGGSPSQAPAAPRQSSGTPPASARPDEPGEFTRIFLKDTDPHPGRADEILPPRRSEGVGRSKGFSTPGVSDAVSGDSTFTHLFKDSGSFPAAQPAPISPQSPFGSDAMRSGETPPRFPGERSIPPSSDRSVSQILSNLSSDRPSSPGPRDADVFPYREEPRRVTSAPPVPPPAAEPGGVTQILNRLAPETVRPVVDTPPVRVEAAPKSGPGEYTRMISREELIPSAAPPAPAPAVAPSAPPVQAAPPLPKIQPPAVAVPRIPAVPAPAPAAAAPAALPAAPPIPIAAVPPLPKPALPAAPPAAAPKGKLEAMVPLLLLVNTFLLAVILVVLVFLIKSK